MPEKGNREDDQDHSLSHRLGGGIVLVVLPAILVLSSVAFFKNALAILHSDYDWWTRCALFAPSGLLMLLAVWLAVHPLRRKWKTGRFLLTRAEVAAKVAERRGKLGAGKPFRPQAGYWAFPLFLIAILLGLGIAAIVAGTSMCGCDDKDSRRLAIMLWLCAAILLILPGWFIFKTIRRKVKTGSVLPSQEELNRSFSRCGKVGSLRLRIAAAAMWWLVAIMWTVTSMRGHHADRLGLGWVTAVFGYAAAILWTLQIFRPSTPQCALSVVPHEPPASPETTSADGPSA
jgi:hypothetical protein